MGNATQFRTSSFSSTHINKNRINVVRAVVPLEGSDVGPEVVR